MIADPHSTLLSRFTSWNDLSGQPAVVTYSFAAGIPAGSAGFSTAQQVSTRLALAAWDAVSGLSFVEVPDTLAGAGIDLRFRLDTLAFFSVLGLTTLPPEGGDVALNLSLFRGDSLAPSATRIGFEVLLHEIGHGLGLSHPDPLLADAATNTLMVETLGRGAPVNAPLLWDREAVQDLYGTLEAEAALGLRWSWDATLHAVRGDGTAGADILTGTAYRDALFGGDGRDLLRGGGGDDVLTPGAGDDVIEGGAGFDTLRLDVTRASLHLDNAGRIDSAEGHDRFTGIEAIQTLDGTLALAGAGIVGRLTGLYAAAFGRAPDPGGLAFWNQVWATQPDFNAIAGQFLGSDEFLAGPGLAARFTASGTVRPVGADDAQALVSLAGVVDAGAAFSQGVWLPDTKALLVSELYHLGLDRNPDEAGFRFWLTALDGGMTQERLAAGCQDSAEAAAHGGTGYGSAAALLEAARAVMWTHQADGVVFA